MQRHRRVGRADDERVNWVSSIPFLLVHVLCFAVIFTGFTTGDYAYQMANAVVFFVLTVVISVLQLQIIRRRGVSL